MDIQQVEKYKPIIQNIIDSNVKFSCFENKIEWDFFENSDKAIFAKTGADFKLYVNITSVIHAYEINEPLHVEYFILHEIRHIYQRRFIFLYKTDETNCPAPELAKRYDYEFCNYIKPTDDLEAYYSQQIEFEAFTFSYSVMLYKYGHINYIKLPNYLESLGIQPYIDIWIKNFKDKNL